MGRVQSENQNYSCHFDTLIALVTHLSSTSFESRTVPAMARELALEPEEVRKVVTGFPGFFRQSRTADEDGERFYTVHLRYARRYDKNRERITTEPLKPEELATLLDLISKMVAQESEMSRLYIEITERNRHLFWTTIITMCAAIIAAVSAITTAFIKH